MSQARSPEPIWREDFRFTNVSLVPGTELQVVLVSKDPLSFSKQKDDATAAFLRNHSTWQSWLLGVNVCLHAV